MLLVRILTLLYKIHMEKKYRVIKRDGKIEDFDQGKIERVAKAAGLKPDDAKRVAQNVAQWVTNNTFDHTISSLKIRDKVVEELQRVNSYAAGLYTWYEKTKEKKAS